MKLLLIFKEVHKQFHTSEDFNFLYLYLARPTCLHDCPLLTPVWLLQVLPLSDPPRTAQRHPPPPPPLDHLATDIPILAPLLFTPPRCCVRLDSFSGGKSNPVALSCSPLPVPCSTCLWRSPEISCFFYTFLYCLNT